MAIYLSASIKVVLKKCLLVKATFLILMQYEDVKIFPMST